MAQSVRALLSGMCSAGRPGFERRPTQYPSPCTTSACSLIVISLFCQLVLRTGQ